MCPRPQISCGQPRVANTHISSLELDRDDSDQARFLIGNHHKASSKTGYVLERTGDGGWNRDFDAVGFLGLGHEFNAQSGQRRNT